MANEELKILQEIQKELLLHGQETSIISILDWQGWRLALFDNKTNLELNIKGGKNERKP